MQCDEIAFLRFYRGDRLIQDPARLLSHEHFRYNRLRALRRFNRWRARRTLRSTLVHGPNYFLPFGTERGVITVHDLSVFRYPETHPANRVKSFERLFASSLERAAHLITDSETIRRELISGLSVPEERVSTVALGVDARFHPRGKGEIAATTKKWGLTPGKYGLSVAAFEPRKKIAELMAAWRRLPAAVRQNYPLVLAGAAGWRNEQLHKEIVTAESEGWLKNLGFVDDTQLPQLYAGARLFIYPSIYEGFGLPPIEAMASGTPVIVSNRSSLPEVCGDAARYIEPDDADAFRSAIEESLSDERWRSEIVLRGLYRARLYNWDRCVADTVAIYKEALAQMT
jgi:alpha-1,3-rhamnosyl/mannosyltransferase